MSTPTARLVEEGVSIWLDDLSRERLASGNLKTLVDESSIVGVTTNPTIFAAALADGERYAEGLQKAGYATDPRYADKLKRIANGPMMESWTVDTPTTASRPDAGDHRPPAASAGV